GIDSSKELIKIAKQRMPDAKLIPASAVNLPFPDESFDYVICLAVLHHLKPEQHEKALSEIKRVLKPSGKAGIAVWNKLQPRFIFGKKEQMVPWKLPKQKIQRYYYFFTYWELKKTTEKTRLYNQQRQHSRKKH
ncbi:MAG: class I SAM-dependent methyltransferase, partial [Candidatus Woesearchaeota archaeon]